jgi:hypothetical protein
LLSWFKCSKKVFINALAERSSNSHSVNTTLLAPPSIQAASILSIPRTPTGPTPVSHAINGYHRGFDRFTDINTFWHLHESGEPGLFGQVQHALRVLIGLPDPLPLEPDAICGQSVT